MKKYIIADLINGLYIEELSGNEKIYTDIEWFIEDLGQQATFDLGKIAIKSSLGNIKAIIKAGYGFNRNI
jgi:hypothetical protein